MCTDFLKICIFIGFLFLSTLKNEGADGEHLVMHIPPPVNATSSEVLEWAEVSEELGDYSTAIESYTRLAKSYETTFGPEHSDTISIYRRLYRAYFNSKRLDDALQEAWKIYRLQEKIHGKEGDATVDALGELGLLYYVKDNFDKAAGFLKRAYRLKKSKLGQNHLDTIRILVNLANVYRLSQKPENLVLALRYYEKVYHVLSKEPEIGMVEEGLRALKNYGDVLCIQLKFGEGVQVFQKVFEMSVEKLGEDHDLTLDVKNALFRFLAVIGRSGQAKKILDKKDEEIDQDNNSLYFLVEGKVVALVQQGKFSKAKEILIELYEQEIKKGEVPPKILRILDWAVSLCLIQDDEEQGLNYATIMIDLIQNQKVKVKVNAPVQVTKEEDAEYITKMYLSALETIIKSFVEKRDKEKIDQYFSPFSTPEVTKGQGQFQFQFEPRSISSTSLLEKLFSITKRVVDFKLQMGKADEASRIVNDFLSRIPPDGKNNGRDNNSTALWALGSLFEMAVEQNDYTMMKNMALRFLKPDNQHSEQKKKPKEDSQEKLRVMKIVCQHFFRKASESYEEQNYAVSYSLYKTLEIIWPKPWAEHEPYTRFFLDGITKSALMTSKFDEALFYAQKHTELLKTKLINTLNLNLNLEESESERMRIVKEIEWYENLQHGIKEASNMPNFIEKSQHFQNLWFPNSNSKSESESHSTSEKQEKEKRKIEL